MRMRRGVFFSLLFHWTPSSWRCLYCGVTGCCAELVGRRRGVVVYIRGQMSAWVNIKKIGALISIRRAGSVENIEMMVSLKHGCITLSFSDLNSVILKKSCKCGNRKWYH